jgi:hypothetical protein
VFEKAQARSHEVVQADGTLDLGHKLPLRSSTDLSALNLKAVTDLDNAAGITPL